MWPMALGICERLSAKSCRSCDQWSLNAKGYVKCCIVQNALGRSAKIVIFPWGMVALVKYNYVCVCHEI